LNEPFVDKPWFVGLSRSDQNFPKEAWQSSSWSPWQRQLHSSHTRSSTWSVQHHHALHCWEKIRVAIGLELTEKTSRTPSKLKQLMCCREEAMELIRWISSTHHNPHVWCPKREITNHTYCELGEKNTKPDVTGTYVMFEAWLLVKSGHQILRTTRFYQSHHWDYFSGSRICGQLEYGASCLATKGPSSLVIILTLVKQQIISWVPRLCLKVLSHKIPLLFASLPCWICRI
jgi:hypothetical protein